MDDEINNLDDFPPLPSTLPPSSNTPLKVGTSENNDDDDDLPLIPPPLPFQFHSKEQSNNDAFDDDEEFPLPPPEELLSPKSAPLLSSNGNIFDKNIIRNIKDDLKTFDEKINDTITVNNKVATITDSNSPIHSMTENEGSSVVTEFLSYANVLSGSVKPSSLKKMAFSSPAPFKINKNPPFSSNKIINKPTISNPTISQAENSNSTLFNDVANMLGSLTNDVINNEPTANEISDDKTNFEKAKFNDDKDSGIFSGSEVIKTPKFSANNDEVAIDNEVFLQNNSDVSDQSSNKIDPASSITNRTYNTTLKKLTNNQLNEVLKDYYKDDEPSKEDTEKKNETESGDNKKLQKPIIAQALLPKNQRQTSDSGQNNADSNILTKRQSFNVTLDELKSFLNPETGVKIKLKNADDFYLGKRTTVVSQNDDNLGVKGVEDNNSTGGKNATETNALQNPQDCLDSRPSIKENSSSNSVSSPTKGILSPKLRFEPLTTVNKKIHEVKINENLTKETINNEEFVDDSEKKQLFKNIEPKPTKLSKSTSLKLGPGVRPKVPNVKGFTDEQIRQLVESQKPQNPGSTTKEENSNIDVQNNLKNNFIELPNVNSLDISKTNNNLKNLDHNVTKIKKPSNDKHNLMSTSESNISKEIVKNEIGNETKVELDLQSKKLFFEQISKHDQKKGESTLFRSKSSVHETSNHHRKIGKKDADSELKAIFEKKFTQAQKNNNEINETNLVNVNKVSEPNKSRNSNVFEDQEPIVSPPISETKAYFESKVSTSKPFKPAKNKVVSLKKSASMLEKPLFYKKDPNFLKDNQKLDVVENKKDESELLENDEDDAANDCEQETVETLVNKYRSLRSENGTEGKIKLGALGKSSSFDRKITVPIEPENRKLPGKSLASLATGTKSSESNQLGTKTWSATLKAYAHKSDQ